MTVGLGSGSYLTDIAAGNIVDCTGDDLIGHRKVRLHIQFGMLERQYIIDQCDAKLFNFIEAATLDEYDEFLRVHSSWHDAGGLVGKAL